MSKTDWSNNKKTVDKWNHIFDSRFYNQWIDDDTFNNKVLDNICMLNLDFRKRKVLEKYVLLVVMFRERRYEINIVKIIGQFLSELYSLNDYELQ